MYSSIKSKNYLDIFLNKSCKLIQIILRFQITDYRFSIYSKILIIRLNTLELILNNLFIFLELMNKILIFFKVKHKMNNIELKVKKLSMTFQKNKKKFAKRTVI